MANPFEPDRSMSQRGGASAVSKVDIPDEIPMFHRQRVNFDPLDEIVQQCVCSNYLIMGLKNNTLTRIDIDNDAKTDEIELARPADDSISAMFLDPTGRHMIVCMTSGDNLYVAKSFKKPRPLKLLKGHKITAVGWNRQNSTDQSTAEILIGTSKDDMKMIPKTQQAAYRERWIATKMDSNCVTLPAPMKLNSAITSHPLELQSFKGDGLVIETMISSEESSATRLFSAGAEAYAKQVLSLCKDKVTSVWSIEFDRMPSTGSSEQQYFILITCGGKLYEMVGGVAQSSEAPIFSQIFSRYEHSLEPYIELPGSVSQSKLHLFHSKGTPKSFAWMTGAGVYYGLIDLSNKRTNHEVVTVDTKLIPYKKEDKSSQPVCIVLTEFHVLVLYPQRMRGICCINDNNVYCHDFKDSPQLLGLMRDPVKGVIWGFAKKSIFKFKVIREARDVWPVYLDRNEFDLAKRYCMESQGDLNEVLVKEAEYLFENKRYSDSARVYADTSCSFEEISLKFVAIEDKKPLKQFLLNKLLTLKQQEKTQSTMIVIWLVELHLNELGQLREGGSATATQYDQAQEAFRKFLNMQRIKESVTHNKSTVYQLISSHGDLENLIFFAILIQDYERVITHHIQQENYRSALEQLSRQTNKELFYTFSPQLMQNIPTETVNMWINKRDLLEPRRLIPALVQYDSSQGDEAIRYLEFCVQKLNSQDQSIHNYLLSLYAKLRPHKLMNYLNSQGQELDQIHYDAKYALRVCEENGQREASVHIYSTMGLFDEAVDLALQVDVELAKQNANRPDDDNEELRRKLWLKIARHVVEKEKDIKRAMEFLKECELLKIEDILPFFPDFVTIDHFKDAICSSLQDYSRHIEDLKNEMNSATENAKEIKSEILAYRNKFSYVRGDDKCSVCSYPLMVNSFYLFPCGHKFHTDCLTSEVIPHLSDQVCVKVKDLQRKIASLERGGGGNPSQPPQQQDGRTSPSLKLEPTYREELDEIVAAECLYCGDIMISSVDKPFIDEREYDKIVASWL